MPIDLAPWLAPAILLLAGLLGFSAHGRRPRFSPVLSEAATLLAFAAAVASAAGLLLSGTPALTLGRPGWGPSIRLDAVSVTMLLLVTFVGWVVVRYARTYLDGEERQGAFTGWLCLTLAAVLVLVSAGNLVQLVVAWIATSLFLHRLLLFYPTRIAAQRAARKKFVTARLGDAALLGAARKAELSTATLRAIAAVRAGGGRGL